MTDSHARAQADRRIVFDRYKQSQAIMGARVWCGKVAYFDKKGAKAAQRRKPANRIYRCPLCHHWHMTSAPQRAEA
jgi:hypothetical protein